MGPSGSVRAGLCTARAHSFANPPAPLVSGPEKGHAALMADPILSPCVKRCAIDPQLGICTGCRRSLAEIAAWGRMSPKARRRIMADLPARQPLPDIQGQA